MPQVQQINNNIKKEDIGALPYEERLRIYTIQAKKLVHKRWRLKGLFAKFFPEKEISKKILKKRNRRH